MTCESKKGSQEGPFFMSSQVKTGLEVPRVIQYAIYRQEAYSVGCNILTSACACSAAFIPSGVK